MNQGTLKVGAKNELLFNRGSLLARALGVTIGYFVVLLKSDLDVQQSHIYGLAYQKLSELTPERLGRISCTLKASSICSLQ
jgi:hypothetical protein